MKRELPPELAELTAFSARVRSGETLTAEDDARIDVLMQRLNQAPPPAWLPKGWRVEWMRWPRPEGA